MSNKINKGVERLTNELGKYLEKLRGTETLRGVAERTNHQISFTYLRDIEKGINRHGNPIKPSPATLQILAKVYQTDYTQLLQLAGYLPANMFVTSPVDSKNVVRPAQPFKADSNISVFYSVADGKSPFFENKLVGALPVPANLIDKYGFKNIFGLRISGDSMNKLVPDGYTSVFAKASKPVDGSLMAFSLGNGETLLRKIKATSSAIILESESFSPAYQPVIIQNDSGTKLSFLGKYLFSTNFPI